MKTALNSIRFVVCFLGCAALLGCDAPKAHYDLDLVYLRKQEKSASDFTPEQKQDVADILTGMFGTPDEPFVPGELAALVDFNRIEMAAGPVASDRTGRAQRTVSSTLFPLSRDHRRRQGPDRSLFKPLPARLSDGRF